METWYEAEYAKSGRSKCKEFRCKETLAAGELRIGIKIEECDHWGSDLGWYHPDCLFKTFHYKSNGNRPITKESDVVGLDDLEDADQQTIRKLIKSGGKRSHPDTGSAPGSPMKGTVQVFVEDNVLFVTGKTFDIKDRLKAAGASWFGAAKRWGWRYGYHQRGLEFFNLAELPSTKVTINLAALSKETGPSPAKRAKKSDAGDGGGAGDDGADGGDGSPDLPLPVASEATIEERLDFSHTSVAHLKALLKVRGLPVSGTKAQLVARCAGAGKSDVPCPDEEAYRKKLKSMVSCGHLSGVPPSEMP